MKISALVELWGYVWDGEGWIDPAAPPVLTYRQTQGGMYDSHPDPSDVLAEMCGEDWEHWRYADRGHGEYIRNVTDVAEELARRGVFATIDAVATAMESLVRVDR